MALPTTLNGKVDRKRCPSREDAARRGDQGVMSAVEKKMARVWSRVLGVADIGPESNFFDLGGDSLGVIKVQAAITAVRMVRQHAHVLREAELRGVCASSIRAALPLYSLPKTRKEDIGGARLPASEAAEDENILLTARPAIWARCWRRSCSGCRMCACTAWCAVRTTRRLSGVSMT